MKLYFAGNTLSAKLEMALYHAGAKKRLYTYWEISGEIGKNKAYSEGFKFELKHGNVFIDSGAYSAKTHNQSISTDNYATYLQSVKGNVDCATCLDVIGDYGKTQRNYASMLEHKYGFPILNVVHVGCTKEQIRDAIIATSSNYIAVGGMVGAKRNKTLSFLNKFWTIAKEYPEFKVHAFGKTAFDILTSYPFYSADSTNAIVGGGMGRILTFVPGRSMASHSHKKRQHVTAKNFIGVDNGKTAHGSRRILNVQETVKMERYITRLWAKRGIKWDD
jgi:hypothetical protein